MPEVKVYEIIFLLAGLQHKIVIVAENPAMAIQYLEQEIRYKITLVSMRVVNEGLGRGAGCCSN